MRFAERAALGGIAAWIALAGTPVCAQEAAVVGADGARIVHLDAVAAPVRIQRSGKFRIRCTLRVNAALPAGTVLSIYASASATSAPYSNTATLSGTATVAAGAASFTLEIPYKWLVASASAQVTMYISIGGGAQSGTTSRYNQTFLTRSLALPVDGANTTLNFAGSI